MRMPIVLACSLMLALATLTSCAVETTEGLRSADPQARVKALDQLATRLRDGNHLAAIAIGLSLQDTDPQVRDQARQVLSHLPDPVIAAVLAATRDADATTRRQALLVLSAPRFYQQRECAFIAPQLFGLEDSDSSVREAAHWSLQQMHDDPSIQAPLRSLRREYGQGLRPRGLEGGYPREQLLVSLGWPANADPVPQVMAGLKSPDSFVRRWSAWLVGSMDRPEATQILATMLTDENPLVRLGAAEALGQIFNPAVARPLVSALCDTDPGVRRQAILSLGNAHMYAVRYQINAIDHYVDDLTVSTAKALEDELIRAGVIETLLGCLQDQEASVRAAAACVLAGFPTAQDAVVPALLPLLKDPAVEVVRTTVVAFSSLRDARTIAPLLDALKAHPDMEDIVVNALGNIGGDQVIELLICMLCEGNERQRLTAASQLANMRGSKVVDALLLALSDASESVRFHTALNFRGQVKDPRLTDRFCTLLSDSSANVRQASARALTQLRDARAVEPLCKALTDSGTQVRMRAAEALGAIKDPKAVEALIAALHDEHAQNRVAVLSALRDIGDGKAVPAIIDMLKDANAAVRHSAVQALVHLTRQNFGEDATKWRAWWEQQEE